MKQLDDKRKAANCKKAQRYLKRDVKSKDKLERTYRKKPVISKDVDYDSEDSFVEFERL